MWTVDSDDPESNLPFFDIMAPTCASTNRHQGNSNESMLFQIKFSIMFPTIHMLSLMDHGRQGSRDAHGPGWPEPNPGPAHFRPGLNCVDFSSRAGLGPKIWARLTYGSGLDSVLESPFNNAFFGKNGT